MEQENNEQEVGEDVKKASLRPKRSNLKKILQDRKMQQKHLAQLADLETAQISLFVKGNKDGERTDLLMSTAVKICKVLECTLDEAFGDLVRELKVD